MTRLTGARNSGKKLYGIYESLLSEFGSQGWWPTIADGEMAYHPGDYSFPHTEEQRFEIISGALLTQNTNWKNVEKALLNLHGSGNLSPERILSLPLSELETLIRPAGYFRQKARRLKSLSEACLKADEGATTEDLRSHFLSINGVGPETADSILLYAYGRPSFVIDAYTRRMCASLNLFHGKSYGDYRNFFQSNLPPEPELFNEFHALMVEWGKRNQKKPI
ncbi:endonuclease III domain-containing protein [Candidatus Micrarchaeota archaeon]|nr:endonuclease III domain-containing protein [Candidatus Micrarchaeota archaeon]